MFEIKAICDRCKAEKIETSPTKYGYCHIPKDWQKVSMKISQYEEKEYMFCEKCRKELGLYNPDGGNKEVKIETVEERLFNVIAEVVQTVQG